MRKPESFIGQPIRSLQTMLRVIAENDDAYDSIISDGIYGPETVQTVSVFQRQHGLPITGITDQQTWEAVVSRYDLALIEQDEAEAIRFVLNPGEVICRGDQKHHIWIVQAILQALADIYGSIGQPSHSGVLDDATSDALASFQSLTGLPMTGNLDKSTWKQLALHYPLALNLPDIP